jgi:hypothetical protein
MAQSINLTNEAGPKVSVWRFVPMLTVMATIFLLSHQSGDSISLPNIIEIDKIAHALIYGILAATTLYAIFPYKFTTNRLVTCASVALFCLLYGLSDEFHQSFIAGRESSVADVAADFLGATLTVLLWRWQYKKFR